MATVRAIINAALRKVGVVNEGQAAAPDYDAANGLEVLQAWYDGAMAAGLFGRLTDVVSEVDYTAKEFERITNTGDADIVVTLPATVADALTGETRVPLDLAPVVVVYPGAAPQNYVYDGIVGDWVLLTALTLDDAAPFSQRGSDGLACLLAVQMADEYGYPVGQVTVGRATRFLTTLNQRNGSQRRNADHEFF